MRIIQLALIILIVLFLVACPHPYRYELLSKNQPDNRITKIAGENISIDFIHVSAWLDTKRMVITIIFEVDNKSSDSLKCVLSEMIAYCKTDTFVTQNYPGQLVNPSKNEKDTLTILPFESRQRFGIDFFSKSVHSRKEFKKIYRQDTLMVKFSIVNKVDTVVSFIKRWG